MEIIQIIEIIMEYDLGHLNLSVTDPVGHQLLNLTTSKEGLCDRGPPPLPDWDPPEGIWHHEAR